MLEQDRVTFEYFYQQCCNDVVNERVAPEIKSDTSIRLASLQIYEYVLTNKVKQQEEQQLAGNEKNIKQVININQLYKQINIKELDQQYGLAHFLPASVYELVKRKELIRLLTHSMKLNQELFNLNPNNINSMMDLDSNVNTGHGCYETTSITKTTTTTASALAALNNQNQSITPLQIKIHYLKMLSELPCYGSMIFNTSRKMMLSDMISKDEPGELSKNKNSPIKLISLNELLIVAPKQGLSYIVNSHSVTNPTTILKIDDINTIKVVMNDETSLFDVKIYKQPLTNDRINGINKVNLNDSNNNSNTEQENIKDLPFFVIPLDLSETEQFIILTRAYQSLLNLKSSKQLNGLNLKSLINQSSINVIWESIDNCRNEEGSLFLIRNFFLINLI